jgi:hypothetical protein
VGKLCIPAPAGVNTDTTAAFVSLSGGNPGMVILDTSNADCRANEFEVFTANPAGTLYVRGILFNILVP